MNPMQPMKPLPNGGSWWPETLGSPSSSGAQNDTRYAYFPVPHRLAVQRNGRVELFDTTQHRITGFAQNQGNSQALMFTTDYGTVELKDLPAVSSD